MKIRGNRIELGEIEAALAAHESVRETVVTAVDDAVSGKRLVAYLVPQDERATHRRWTSCSGTCGAGCPSTWCPRRSWCLDELPLLPNGKVNRQALARTRRVAAGTGSRVRGAPQRRPSWTLARIWSDVLGVDRVGVRDNFFALGGDSIRSIQVLAKAREANLGLSLQQLFTQQTIEQLALVAGQGVGEAAVPRTEPWSLVSRRRPGAGARGRGRRLPAGRVAGGHAVPQCVHARRRPCTTTCSAAASGPRWTRTCCASRSRG